jgi:hypothetical protein
MRVMVLVKASPESEAGAMPATGLLEAMGRYNEALAQAGVLLAGEGLTPSARGARVSLTADGGAPAVLHGPFAATTELVAGFWLWQVRDMDEAIAWARRCPAPMPGGGELELRPVVEAEDFGEAFTPELRAAEERLRADLAQAGER